MTVTVQTYNELLAICKMQQEEISALKAKIIELESRLNKNSNNSHKPPSSDGYKKNRSLRSQSGRASGGQPGHLGKTLQQVEKVDYVFRYQVTSCKNCGKNLGNCSSPSEEGDE